MSTRKGAVCLLLAALVSACSSNHGTRTASRLRPAKSYYPAPGPTNDPWGPYVQEASTRFRVPPAWIREVMRQESGGHQYLNGDVTMSAAGAIGLMQVMPGTYDGLRRRYGLGDDPFDPHDNIMAGTGYIREMYDRYGSPNFLAAYNAGPARLDAYLAGTSSLPQETVSYLAAVGPRLGGGSPTSGPLAAYADAGTVAGYSAAVSGVLGAPTPASAARIRMAMEPIVSPGDPGGGAIQVASMYPVVSPGDPGTMAPIVSPGDYPDASTAPAPVTQAPAVQAPVMQAPLAAAYPVSRPLPNASSGGYRLVTSPPPSAPFHAIGGDAGGGDWAVQVGAYASAGQARDAAERARSAISGLPPGVHSAVGVTSRPDGAVLFRARLVNLSVAAAGEACRRMRDNGRACIIVPPGGAS